jgi:hypothetical protein
MTSWESFDNVNSIREAVIQRGMNVLTIYEYTYIYITFSQHTRRFVANDLVDVVMMLIL